MLTKDLNRVTIANKANGKRSLTGQALPVCVLVVTITGAKGGFLTQTLTSTNQQIGRANQSQIEIQARIHEHQVERITRYVKL
ncbi:hypothetical protein HanPSC8_Chr09g0396321 [Helianthus annuus]|nr:hypothetical protein HanPSC8_Chr09g0396321 [Helianthus annuus]